MATNSTPIEDDDPGIRARLDRLTDTLDGVHETLRLENEKRDKRIRTNRWAIALALIVGIVGGIIGIVGINEIRKTNRERDESRVAACQQYNLQQDQGIAAEIAQSHDFVDAITAGRPDLAQVVIDYNRRHDRLIREGHPKRDCSPQGIEEYLEQQASQ